MRQRPSLDAPFGEAINLGPQVNSPADERKPTLSSDGLTLVVASSRDNPQRPELWMSRRASQADAFGPPTKFGPAVNNGQQPVSSGMLLADGQTLFFRRSGPLHLTFTSPTGIQSALELRDHPFDKSGGGASQCGSPPTAGRRTSAPIAPAASAAKTSGSPAACRRLGRRLLPSAMPQRPRRLMPTAAPPNGPYKREGKSRFSSAGADSNH